jgi:hypothetical protein
VTMETILNLLWLGITLVAIWLWRFRWVTSRRNQRRDARLEAIAMVCILALLFPVISLTDDLHPEVVPVDSISSKRNQCLLVAGSAHADHSKVPSRVRSWVALISHSPEEIRLVFSGFVLSCPVCQAFSIDSPRSTRSPPALA